MEVKQISTILNQTIVPEATGSADVVLNEDLSNIVEIGQAVDQYLAVGSNVDNSVKKIIDKIGKTINWTRPYIGMAPNIIRDSWEYGSILEKNRASLVAYAENPTWGLTANTDYLDGKYYMPDVDSTLYNKKTTFEVNMSFAERQFKEAVHTARGVASFFGMIESRIGDSMTVALDALAMRTINSFIVEHFKEGKGVINLLALYNTAYTQNLTAAAALTDKSFLRFACMQLMLWKSRIRGIGQQFNLEQFDTHTPYEDQIMILHSDFAAGVKVYLESDTFHNDLLKFGEYQEVPYWQSSKGFTVANTMAIGGKPVSGEWTETVQSVATTYTSVSCQYVIGAIIDKDAVAICCEDSRVTTQYVPKGEFYTNFYKRDAEFLNDLAMNGIIFTLADPVKVAKS